MNGDDAARMVSGTWNGLGDDTSNSDVPAGWIDGCIWISDATPPVLWPATDVSATQTMLTLDATFVRDITATLVVFVGPPFLSNVVFRYVRVFRSLVPGQDLREPPRVIEWPSMRRL